MASSQSKICRQLFNHTIASNIVTLKHDPAKPNDFPKGKHHLNVKLKLNITPTPSDEEDQESSSGPESSLLSSSPSSSSDHELPGENDRDLVDSEDPMDLPEDNHMGEDVMDDSQHEDEDIMNTPNDEEVEDEDVMIFQNADEDFMNIQNDNENIMTTQCHSEDVSRIKHIKNGDVMNNNMARRHEEVMKTQSRSEGGLITQGGADSRNTLLHDTDSSNAQQNDNSSVDSDSHDKNSSDAPPLDTSTDQQLSTSTRHKLDFSDSEIGIEECIEVMTISGDDSDTERYVMYQNNVLTLNEFTSKPAHSRLNALCKKRPVEQRDPCSKGEDNCKKSRSPKRKRRKRRTHEGQDD